MTAGKEFSIGSPWPAPLGFPDVELQVVPVAPSHKALDQVDGTLLSSHVRQYTTHQNKIFVAASSQILGEEKDVGGLDGVDDGDSLRETLEATTVCKKILLLNCQSSF